MVGGAPGPRVILLGIAVISLAWGTTYPAIAVMVRTVPAWLGAGARFVLAGCALALLVLARGGLARLRMTRGELASCALAGLLLTTCAQGLIIVAQQQVSAGVAALVAASSPMWILVLRGASREQVPRATMLAVAGGLTSVALVALPGDGGDAPVGGVLLVLLSALAWAAGSFVQGRLPRPPDALAAAAGQLVAGGLAALAVAVATGEPGDLDLHAVSPASAAALAFMVLVGSVLAMGTYTWLLRHAPISQIATHGFVSPIIAVALGAIVLGETVTATTIAATALVVVSVATVIRGERRAPVATA